MIRARFLINGADYRPVVWPIKHPYWCTGYSYMADSNDKEFEAAVIVAYADDEDEIRRLWPDAAELNSEPVESYFFSDRFPVPRWFDIGKELP